jgi:class 3 adenylate cyclase
MLNSWVSSIDGSFEHPSLVRIWDTIGRVASVALFDLPGLGASDPPASGRLGDLDEAVECALAVLDATGLERVAVFAEHDGTAIAVRLAVEHPERVGRLLLSQPAPAWRGPGQADDVARWMRRHWGDGVWATVFGEDAPRYERTTASRWIAAEMLLAVSQWDVRSLLPLVAVDTVVLHLDYEDPFTHTLEEDEAVAAAVPSARFVSTRPTTNYWGGGTWEAVIEFLAGEPGLSGERELVTLLFTDVVSSTDRLAQSGDKQWREVLRFMDLIAETAASQAGGQVVNRTGDGHVLAFSRPYDAVRAARTLIQAMRDVDVHVRAGVHTGEVERLETGDVAGVAVHIAARIQSLATADEILLSRTTAELLAGSDINVEDRGEHELKGLPGRWQIMAII